MSPRSLSATLEELRRGTADLKPAQVLSLAREISSEGESFGLVPLRVGFLSSFSLEFLEPYAIVEAALRGFVLEAYFGAFGQFEQELASADGALADFDPQVLVLALRPEDIEPDIYRRFYRSSGRGFSELRDHLVARLAGCVRMFRSWSRAPVLASNFAAPADRPLGVFDANAELSLTHELMKTNLELRNTLCAEPDVAIWDYSGLVYESGAATWTDPRLMALARVPIASRNQPRAARHLVRTLSGVLRPPAKCLVLDLDNTLWGGVIGDDGLEGIQLGDDHPGIAYKSFQRSVMGLRDRGILLAIASKNDQATAEQVFREHPEMLISLDDLSASRINWRPKSENLKEIAEELNLSLDAFVFFDDNPVEREEVRARAPSVRVVEVPADPLQFERVLAECGEFDMTGLTREDAQRAELYQQEKQRHALRSQVDSLDDFLVSLEMIATVGRLGPETLGRIAQLIGKTNQFNLTTRRHSRADLEVMSRDPNHAVGWLRLADRYGDAGLVAVAILRRTENSGVIDTFLMSCRVMSRKVEQALLSYMLEHARKMGCPRIVGEYRPTPKNGIVASFYPDHAFADEETTADGVSRYVLDLASAGVSWPDCIARIDEHERR